MARIILADDHTILRKGLVRMLSEKEDIEIIGEASDGFTALQMTRELCPDILIVDLSMPRLNGLEVTQRAKKEKLCPRIIVLSMRKGEPYIRKALKNGADAYVLKSEDPQDLIDAIECVSKGEMYLSPKVAKMAATAFISSSLVEINDPYDELTAREKEVLQLSAENMSNEEIADFLMLSIHTIVTHRRNLMRKLGIKNQGELMRFAIDRGIISTDI